MVNFKKAAIALLIVFISFSAGRFFSPVKTETIEIEKIVYKDRIQTERDQNVREFEKETRLPDGTIIKERTKTKETETRTRTETEVHSDRITEKRTENRPDWMATFVYEPALAGIQEVHYQGLIQRRIIGELYIGLSVRSDKSAGVSVTLGF